ncbi:MAG: SidA/IucD/PvdA family monooxygenase, partial [Acidobacteriota bacterium]
KAKQWRVLIQQGETKVWENFDGVALCQGLYWKPFIPSIKGLDLFQGKIIHAGQYYDNQVLQDKRVLVIGNGVSGMDIAEEASQTAKDVFWSMRSLKLIMPRMTGFLPNDFQSPASLLIQDNANTIIERLRHSMPQYYALYEQSGLLPKREDFKKNPVVHINDNIVKLVAEGKVQSILGEVEEFVSDGCIFAGSKKVVKNLDVVVFCTGYQTSTPWDYLKDISINEFSMGIFYHKNPSLVNTSCLLPVAFSGTFYFPEMVSRWYAQIMSGNYQLSQQELDHRIGQEHAAINGPISSVLFGLKLGLLPKPEKEFKEFWQLLNYPSFPMIYRLRGPHQDSQAQELLTKSIRHSLLKNDQQDQKLQEVKYRLLAGLGRETLQDLLKRREITETDYQEALNKLHAPLSLDWESQYIKSGHYCEEEIYYKRLVSKLKNNELDAETLIKELWVSA